MSTLHLRDIERHTWRMTQENGLIDVLFGFMLLAPCLGAVLERVATASSLRLVATLGIQFSGAALVWWARRVFVAPRIGRVRFAARRVRRIRSLCVVLAWCVLGTVTLVVLTALSNRLGFPFVSDLGGLSVWAIVAIVVLLPLASMAVVLEFPRYLLYGALIVGIEFLHLVLHVHRTMPYLDELAYGIVGLTAFAIGIPIFLRFLRSTRPSPSDEEVST